MAPERPTRTTTITTTERPQGAHSGATAYLAADQRLKMDITCTSQVRLLHANRLLPTDL
jgi:hypothetical protein